MSEFLTTLQHPFLRNALMAGLLASFACGVIGTYVVTRRITYVAGGISHCILGGIGLAVYFRKALGWHWITPLEGAAVVGLIAAFIIGFVTLRAKQREDTVIGALWAIGMAVGVIAISRTPGYNEDLMSYLFGNILMVSSQDLWLIALLDAAILLCALVFYNPFFALCFDEEFARVRGLRVTVYYQLLLCLTALTVVLLVSVVGTVMVIALLTLPVAVAGHFARRLSHMMVLSVILSMAFTTGGLAISYGPDLPAGATIIILAGSVYLITVLLRSIPGLRGKGRVAQIHFGR